MIKRITPTPRKETILATVPVFARSTRKSLPTTTARSAAPASQNPRSILRRPININASAADVHKIDRVACARTFRARSPKRYGTSCQKWIVRKAPLSILWTSAALALMLIGRRKMERGFWLAGAALLAVVVGKLFLVDLANTGTVARIVSFLGVGVILLIIGYVAPVPPGVNEVRGGGD